VLGSFAFSDQRNRLVDCPYVSRVSQMAVMIPKPEAQKTNRIYAICQPFEPYVYFLISYFFNILK